MPKPVKKAPAIQSCAECDSYYPECGCWESNHARKYWHEWIDECDIESVITKAMASYEAQLGTVNESDMYLTDWIAQAIRKLIKGEL